MTFILFLLFAVVIFVVMFLLTIVRGVTSFIFGKPSSHGGHSNNTSSTNRSPYDSPKPSTKKIFSESEGEYVKFEELKD